MLPIAARPIAAAATAKPVSRLLIRRTGATAVRRGAVVGATAGRGEGIPVEVGGRVAAPGTGVAPLVGGRGAAGAAAATPTDEEAAGAGAGALAPPAGAEGNRIVGEADGFGGKLIRTVSFFGWTLAASAGFGGGAGPPVGVGVFSAITMEAS